MKKFFIAVAFTVAVAMTPNVQADVIIGFNAGTAFDGFGPGSSTVGTETWNDYTATTDVSAGGGATGFNTQATLVDTSGTNTGITLGTTFTGEINTNPADGGGNGFSVDDANADAATNSIFWSDGGTMELTVGGLAAENGNAYLVEVWAGLDLDNANGQFGVVGSNEGTQFVDISFNAANDHVETWTGTVTGGQLVLNFASDNGATPDLDGSTPNGLFTYSGIRITTGQSVAVPEPTALAVLGLGMVGLVTRRRRES